MRRPTIILAVLSALAGCASPPPAVMGKRAETVAGRYPSLRPLDDLLAAAPEAPATDPAAPVEARAAALRRKAAGLRALDTSG